MGVCAGPRPALGVRTLRSLNTTDARGRIFHFRGAALGGCRAFSSGSGLCPLGGNSCPLMVTTRPSAGAPSTGGPSQPSLCARVRAGEVGDGRADRHDGRMDGWMGMMDGWMDGWMEGWINK